MTKAELIRKFSKSSGIPDQDAKIFFELLLKRISSATKIGQSLFLNGYGYFNLIKGSIKKPVFTYEENEAANRAWAINREYLLVLPVLSRRLNKCLKHQELKCED